jgi:hypothetical protein
MTIEATHSLRAAWGDYCERLKAAGELIFSAEPDGSDLDLAVGIQYLSRQLAKGLKLELEFKDARFPQLWTLQTPVSKNFGDNPNCNYLVAFIDGSETYRLWGNRGTVSWIRMATRLLQPDSGLNYVDGVPPGPFMAQEDIQFEPDGSFVALIGPDEQPGNWLRTDPGAQQLIVRQFFGSWTGEQPMSLQLERVRQEGQTPAPLSAARVVQGLSDAAAFVERDTAHWIRWADFYEPRANEFVPGVPDWTGAVYKASSESKLGRLLNFCFFKLDDDEALLIEFTPPPCFMWVFEQNNRWMTSVDYRYHFSSLNSAQAIAEDDGSVRIVVSNTDPGIPNWLDPAGHRQGLLINRWVDPVGEQNPLPATRVVNLDELEQVLAGVRRIDPNQRLRQRRGLRDGVANRFQL